jgi:hypothetical protein
MAIELTSRYGVDKTTKSLNPVKFQLFPDIWYLSDITGNVLSIIKVKEYRFRVQIIIFSGNYMSRSSQNALQQER